MRIGTSHRNKIWKALVEYHSESTITINDSQSLPRDTSTASTISMTSQASISQNSQNSTYCPGYYEVTRYTFKHTISYTKTEGLSKRTRVEWNVTKLFLIPLSYGYSIVRSRCTRYWIGLYWYPNNKNLISVVALWWSRWTKEYCTDQMQYGANVIFYFGRFIFYFGRWLVLL